MNYYIKVEKMYVYDIYIDNDSVKTEFIRKSKGVKYEIEYQ